MSTINELRDLFTLTPSVSLWNQICVQLDSLDLSPDGDYGWLLEYALHHLEIWPDSLRQAPPHWLSATLAGESVQGWPLVRSIVMKDAPVAEIRKLCKSREMGEIRACTFDNCKLGPKGGLQALGKAKYLPALTSLSIKEGVVTNDGWEMFVELPLLEQIESLELLPEIRFLSHKQQLSDRYYKVLAEASHLTKLRSLSLGFIEPISRGGNLGSILPALAQAPHLQALESVKLLGWQADAVALFVEHYGWENVVEVDLWGSEVSQDTLRFLTDKCSSWTKLRLNHHYSFDAMLHHGIRSDALEQFLADADLSSLTSLTLDVQDEWTTDTFLKCGWLSSLKELTIVGRLKEDVYVQLAKGSALSSLETLALHRPYTEESYCKMRSLPFHSLSGVKTALAWLETTERPALKRLESSLRFQWEEGDESLLAETCQKLSSTPPYPAWTQWVETLEHAGIALETGTTRSAKTRESYELKSIKFEYGDSIDDVVALLENGPLESCGTLVLDINPAQKKPEDLFAELLASPKLQRLEHLDLGSVGSFSISEELNKILYAIAQNPALSQLQTFSHGMNGYVLDTLPGFLAVKTSPHLAGSVREPLSIKSTYSSCFSPWNDGRQFKALFDCEELFHIEALDLSQTYLRDEGTRLLAECEYLTELKRLDLSRCGIGDVGAKALAKSTYLTSLEELKLGYNDITVEGYKALVESETLPKKVTKKFKRKAKG
jgi:hypothetical protein